MRSYHKLSSEVSGLSSGMKNFSLIFYPNREGFRGNFQNVKPSSKCLLCKAVVSRRYFCLVIRDFNTVAENWYFSF